MLILKIIGDFFELHFFPLACLELAGIVLLFRWPRYFQADRKKFSLLLGGGIFFFLWRFPIVGTTVASRYFLATLIILLPFAAVPFTLRINQISSLRWRKIIISLLFFAAILTISSSIIKRMRIRRINPIVMESVEYLKKNSHVWNSPTEQIPLLFNQSTRGEQILYQAGILSKTCWVPNYKELELYGSGATRIRERLGESPALPDTLIISYRTEDISELREVLILAEQKYGYRIVAEFQSKLNPEFWLFLLRRE